jgi:lysozyme
MKTSDQGRRLLIERESKEYDAYPDPASPLAKACKAAGINFLKGGYKRLAGWENLSGAPWTIGVGHTGPEVHAGLIWTDEQIDFAFAHDLERFERAVQDSVHRDLKPNQNDALVSFAHNIGEMGVMNSWVVREINKGDFVAAAAAFDNWHKPEMIISRRNGEREQFKGTRFEARIEE